MHMSFLSMKQLLYLERYGRMYTPEEGLFGDKAFIRTVLEGAPPLPSHTAASNNGAEPQVAQGSQPRSAAAGSTSSS